MDLPETPAASRVNISLLGDFSVRIDGHLLPDRVVKGKKARSFLKLIAHQSRHQMIRERITDILWPDLDTATANAQLYKVLHHLRKTFAQYGKDALRHKLIANSP